MKLTETDKARIHELRAEGWTYAKIAAEIGCADSTIGKFLDPAVRARSAARIRDWGQRNTARRNELSRQQYKANPEMGRARSRRWCEAHPDAREKFSEPTYVSWRSMIQRCTYPAHKSFTQYGGRGITICPRWRHSFDAFREDMGKRPEGRTLDRINVNGNYEPGNCRWATAKEQRSNRRDSPLKAA